MSNKDFSPILIGLALGYLIMFIFASLGDDA